MARYKDVENYRKLFDEEYKKTRKLISEGETHLDNLAEGFSEASRVIDRIPTADVAPKSEVIKELSERINDSLKCLIDLGEDVVEITEINALIHDIFDDYLSGGAEECPRCAHFVGCESALGGEACDDFEDGDS